MPSSYYSYINIIAKSTDAVNKSNYILDHKTTSGPNSIRVLNRFGYLDEEFSELFQRIIAKEKEINKDIVFAEILYIPEDRAVNISRRGSYYDFEIAILVESSVCDTHTISIDDIYVKVYNQEIIFYSKKIKKHIIPRLSSAINYNYYLTSFSLYKLLCDCQVKVLYQHYFGIGAI